MWTLMSIIIVVSMAFCYIETIQGADNYLFRNLRDLNDEEKLFLAKDPLRNGRNEFSSAVCGRFHDLGYDVIYCNVAVFSSIDPDDRHECGSRTYFRTRDTKLWESFNVEIGVLVDSGKFILSYEEPYYKRHIKRKVMIYDSTCKSKNLEFSYGANSGDPLSRKSSIVVHRNTFDVIIADESKCGTKEKCKLTYDETGDLLGVSSSLPTDYVAVRSGPLRPLSSDGAFFMVGYEENPRGNLSARFVSESGAIKKIDTDLSSDNLSLGIPVSTTYDLFTLCRMRYEPEQEVDGSWIVCRQFDSNSAALKMNVTLGYLNHIDAISIYNFPKEGFLIATLACGNETEKENCNLSVDKIEKVDEHTISINPYESNFKTSCGGGENEIMLDIKPVDSDEYCFYIVCTTKPSPRNRFRTMSLSRKCVTLDHPLENIDRRML
ncbi:hypothetical protein QAD02_000876 [Eretmocerus hayati]|uniref:Uncharacterized protein n=1 Tax=Eretmocerus hayati TaxID=131215 RepID=A0ACC2NEM3_9HYME|nr:hypothetical protein QAD02_000876 [Eretmocerus hayati]